MAREMVAKCDVCGKPDAVEWNIARSGDGHWIVDLCVEHGQAIEDVAGKGRLVEHTKPARAGRTRYDAYVRGVPEPTDRM